MSRSRRPVIPEISGHKFEELISPTQFNNFSPAPSIFYPRSLYAKAEMSSLPKTRSNCAGATNARSPTSYNVRHKIGNTNRSKR
jgi:hypothetical protein